jgi:CBS domain-containing protein
MADLDLGAVPVSEDNQLIGIVTGRDLAIRVVAEARDPEHITVRQAMSSDVLYCFENEHVGDVTQKMGDWWVRRLPVINRDRRLIGMVSLADLTALNAEPRPRDVGTHPHTLLAARPARQTRRARRPAAAA